MNKFWVVLILLVCASAFAADSVPTTVLLVRHAEKSMTPEGNPELTEAGKARALELARVVSMADIKAVYSSQFTRTRTTAEPIAKQLSLQVQVVDAEKTPDLVSNVLSKHAGETVLVVGHSNTLPEIVKAFGGPKIADLEDDEYDNLLVLIVHGSGKAKLVRLKFGEHWK